MANPQWMWFGGLLFLITVGLLWLARLTERVVVQSTGLSDGESQSSIDISPVAVFGQSRSILYTNIVVSHALIGLLVIGIAWFTSVPLAVFGRNEFSVESVVIGISVGLGLAVGNQVAKRLISTAGLSYSEFLRSLLAPSGTGEWVYLSIVVLPVIAITEELVFRGAMIGAIGSGFGVSPWVLAVGSSVLFGLGHSLQGRGGIVVTGAFGFILGVTFIFTGSLLIVIIAHYVVNLIEFVSTNPTHENIIDIR